MAGRQGDLRQFWSLSGVRTSPSVSRVENGGLVGVFYVLFLPLFVQISNFTRQRMTRLTSGASAFGVQASGTFYRFYAVDIHGATYDTQVRERR